MVLTIAVLLAGSVFCFAIGVQSPAALKARLDAMAPGGTALGFPIARVAAIRWMALAAAGLAMALTAGVWAARRLLNTACEHALAAFRNALDWTVRELRGIAPQLAALMALGCILRGLFLGQPIREDEATTYLEFASKPLLYCLSYYPVPNNHIFHTLLAHFATQLFGGEPWAIRLVAFLAGTLMIPAAAMAAIAMRGKEAALPAAALVAVSWPWVFFSASGRGYTLAGVIFLILIPVCVRLRAARDIGAWVWFVVLAALGLFTIPVMAYALVPLGGWVAISRPRAWRELAAAAACTLVITLMLYAPAFTASGFAAARIPEMTPAAAGPALFSRIAKFGLALWNVWHRDLAPWVMAAFACAAMIGWRSGVLAAIAVAWWGAILTIYPAMPYTRVWVWLSLPWLLLVASGLGAVLPRRRVTGFLIIVLVGWQAVRISASGSILRSQDTGTFVDARQAVTFLKRYWQPGDGVEAYKSRFPLLYEFQRQGLPAPGKSTSRHWIIAENPPPGGAEPVVHLRECWVWLQSPAMARRSGFDNVVEHEVGGGSGRKLRP